MWVRRTALLAQHDQLRAGGGDFASVRRDRGAHAGRKGVLHPQGDRLGPARGLAPAAPADVRLPERAPPGGVGVDLARGIPAPAGEPAGEVDHRRATARTAGGSRPGKESRENAARRRRRHQRRGPGRGRAFEILQPDAPSKRSLDQPSHTIAAPDRGRAPRRHRLRQARAAASGQGRRDPAGGGGSRAAGDRCLWFIGSAGWCGPAARWTIRPEIAAVLAEVLVESGDAVEQGAAAGAAGAGPAPAGPARRARPACSWPWPRRRPRAPA